LKKERYIRRNVKKGIHYRSFGALKKLHKAVTFTALLKSIGESRRKTEREINKCLKEK
jgi:hypothetical protein